MGGANSSIETDWIDAMTQAYTEVCPTVSGVQVVDNLDVNLILPDSCSFDVDVGNQTFYDQSCVMNSVINTMQNFAEQNTAFAQSTFSLSESSSIIGINGQELLNQYVTQKCGDVATTQLLINSTWNETGGCPKILDFTNQMQANVYCGMAAFTSDVQSFAATNMATAKTIGLLSGIVAAIMAVIAIVVFVLLAPSLFRRTRTIKSK